MYKNRNFFWRFRGNEKKYLLDVLKKGVKLKKKSYNLFSKGRFAWVVDK